MRFGTVLQRLLNVVRFEVGIGREDIPGDWPIIERCDMAGKLTYRDDPPLL
jgi:hypothetical protein